MVSPGTPHTMQNCTLLRDPAEDVSHFREHGGHVLVGTPGRIDDVLKRCTFMDARRLEVWQPLFGKKLTSDKSTASHNNMTWKHQLHVFALQALPCLMHLGVRAFSRLLFYTYLAYSTDPTSHTLLACTQARFANLAHGVNIE